MEESGSEGLEEFLHKEKSTLFKVSVHGLLPSNSPHYKTFDPFVVGLASNLFISKRCIFILKSITLCFGNSNEMSQCVGHSF